MPSTPRRWVLSKEPNAPHRQAKQTPVLPYLAARLNVIMTINLNVMILKLGIMGKYGLAFLDMKINYPP